MGDELSGRQDLDDFAPAATRTVRYVQEDASPPGIVQLTLNRPPANVLSVDMLQELAAALDPLEYRREVKLVVLRGAGKYFSAGFELGDHLGDRAYPMLEGFRRVFEALLKIDKPTLSVVAGPAFGSGCLLAASCDLAFAARSAKFAHPEIRGGVFNTLAAALLPRLIGRKRALEMLLLGGSLSASDAERIGLVTRAVPDEALETEVATVIQRFQESSAPVVQLARRAIAGGLDLSFDEAVRHAEDVYLNQLAATEDLEEGLKAVAEKRKPSWKDR
jgi:cyclohexa-1,5-dienecarbonyl-CoA hydratase